MMEKDASFKRDLKMEAFKHDNKMQEIYLTGTLGQQKQTTNVKSQKDLIDKRSSNESALVEQRKGNQGQQSFGQETSSGSVLSEMFPELAGMNQSPEDIVKGSQQQADQIEGSEMQNQGPAQQPGVAPQQPQI
jgi:hypothetical protein